MNDQQKITIKRILRKVVGEVYVGKRMKLGYLNSLVDRLPLGDVRSILEVGCSDGLFSEWIQQKFPAAQITALDIDSQNIPALQATRTKINYVLKDILDFSVREQFDLVLALDVLEHIKDDAGAVRRIHQAMKPNGVLIVHVPNHTYHTITGQIHDVPDEDAWKINSGHVRSGYLPEDLRRLLQTVDFDITDLYTAHGYLSDAAHRLYSICEHPTPLRLLALPVIDTLSVADRLFPRSIGNTVFAVARKKALVRNARSEIHALTNG